MPEVVALRCERYGSGSLNSDRPMSVLSKRQRTGIGSALVRGALEAAEARDEPLVLVLGHPTYPRLVFRPASELGITPPDPDLPGPVFMAKPLRACDPTIRGPVARPSSGAGPR